MKKLILFGNSEGSKLMYHSLLHDSSYEVTAFTVDANYLDNKEFCGLPVVPFENVQEIYPPENYDMLIAIFANEINKLRAKKYQEAKDKGYQLINYIHPTSIIARDLAMGDNCFIFEGVLIRPDVKIGNDVIIMPGAFVGHDTIIEDHCYLASRAVVMGAVRMKPYSIIGPNATVMEDITIESECLIGGGAVILQSTKYQEVYRANQATLMPLTSDKLAKFIYRKRR